MKRGSAPHAVDHLEPLRGARVAVVVLVELHAVLLALPSAHHDDTTLSDSRPLLMWSMLAACLASSAGRMERRPHRDHELEPLGDRGERRRRAPGVERRRVDALDVVEIQLGDQREVEADLLAAPRQPAHVVPGRVHPLVVDVAEPAAEDGQPVSEAHQRHLRRAAAPRRSSRLEPVGQPRERIEAEHARRVGDEVRQRVDVVEVELAVAVVDQVLDAADVDAGRAP